MLSELLVFSVISFEKISSSSFSEASVFALDDTSLSTISDKFASFERSNF